MNATYPTKTNLWNKFFLAIFVLPLGMIVLLLAATGALASLIMILTPIGMMLAPTWSVQLFYWKFGSALDAWYLPIFGVLLDLCLFHLVKSIAQFARQTLS
ncbi:MAG: hypothetical protein HY865_14930 [Chloroflexi bacterium]|nr:hypothetical protein [Chloroflexota bacterium]